MKIIQEGKIPTYTKRFTCDTCGTVFDADKGEYHSCRQLEYTHDDLKYECKCPICCKMAYISR